MKLSLVVSNKNRLFTPGTRFKERVHEINASTWFLKSIQWQTFQDCELVIADGGSDNYDELVDYFADVGGPIPIHVYRHDIGDVFLRSTLNNVGVRRAQGEYIATTDADMIFSSDFVQTVVNNVSKGIILELKTFHLRKGATEEIHKGKIDICSDFETCQRTRKAGKPTNSPGGCQCMHRDKWSELHGFDESFYGWGSEDRDLVKRARMHGLKEHWVATKRGNIKILHQEHYKDVEYNLGFQETNKKRLEQAKKAVVNKKEWGGLPV